MTDQASLVYDPPDLDANRPDAEEAPYRVQAVGSIADVDSFLDFVHRPENLMRNWEWIAGKVYEVVSGTKSSSIAMTIGILLGVYVKKHKLGRITGADGGYSVDGQRYIPDVGFVRTERDTREEQRGYLTYAPDLAVEVVSKTDDPLVITRKVHHYLQAGTTVWLISPEAQHLDVYEAGKAPVHYEGDVIVKATGVLEGLEIPLAEVFA